MVQSGTRHGVAADDGCPPAQFPAAAAGLSRLRWRIPVRTLALSVAAPLAWARLIAQKEYLHWAPCA